MKNWINSKNEKKIIIVKEYETMKIDVNEKGCVPFDRILH